MFQNQFKKVKIYWKNKILEGLLLPSPQEDTIILKLNSGYNVGLLKKEIKNIDEIETVQSKLQNKAEPKKDDNLGDISILGSGGTIASKIDYNTGAVYPSITAKELKESFPELKQISTLSVKNLFNIFSEEMQPEHWQKIALETYNELKNGKKGVVILHGTDTMAYTAAALSFALKTPKPIVLTGAQRSSDRPSSDNKENLLNSVFAAKQDFGEVTVCMHSSSSDGISYLHKGTKVRKMHSSRRDAFKSINTIELAKVKYPSIFEWNVKPTKTEELKLNNGFSDKVALLYVYPGMNSSVLEAYTGYKGLVLAGTGLGHISLDKLEQPLKKLIDNGTYVYMTTQTLYGRVNMNVYSTGRRLQEIGVDGNLNDMLPEVAYVKLSWVLNKTNKSEEIKSLMNTNIAGEISERSIYSK